MSEETLARVTVPINGFMGKEKIVLQFVENGYIGDLNHTHVYLLVNGEKVGYLHIDRRWVHFNPRADGYVGRDMNIFPPGNNRYHCNEDKEDQKKEE